MSIAAIVPIIGAVVGSATNYILERKKAKDEERAEIAKEKRAEERYRGIGEAADIDPEANGQLQQSLKREERAASRLGSKPEQVGDRYGVNDSAGEARAARSETSTAQPATVASAPGRAALGATPLMAGNAQRRGLVPSQVTPAAPELPRNKLPTMGFGMQRPQYGQ